MWIFEMNTLCTNENKHIYLNMNKRLLQEEIHKILKIMKVTENFENHPKIIDVIILSFCSRSNTTFCRALEAA